MNHSPFTFVTMENLKNEAPQEVKYDENLLTFGWFNPLWKFHRIFYTTNERRYIFYSWDTRYKLLIGLLVFFYVQHQSNKTLKE